MPARAHRPHHLRDLADQLIREVLRAWLSGAGLRKVAEQAGVDRKTARRYVEAAVGSGLARDGGPGQLTDLSHGNLPECHHPNPQVDRLGELGYRK